MKASKRHQELMKTVTEAQNYLKFRLASGLYLNEENGQTFEIVDTGKFSAYVQYPDFFFTSVVHADEDMDSMLDLVFEGKISYIGEV
jgi:hypothetical protein